MPSRERVPDLPRVRDYAHVFSRSIVNSLSKPGDF